jgi:hypothetical protein
MHMPVEDAVLFQGPLSTARYRTGPLCNDDSVGLPIEKVVGTAHVRAGHEYRLDFSVHVQGAISDWPSGTSAALHQPGLSFYF